MELQFIKLSITMVIIIGNYKDRVNLTGAQIGRKEANLGGKAIAKFNGMGVIRC